MAKRKAEDIEVKTKKVPRIDCPNVKDCFVQQPHGHLERTYERGEILNTILEHVGNTPLVHINKVFGSLKEN